MITKTDLTVFPLYSHQLPNPGSIVVKLSDGPMKMYSFILVLTILIYITFPSTTLADSNTNSNQSFNEQIITLQKGTQDLCSHIEKQSLVMTKKFKTLMRDAPNKCPDRQAMEAALINIESKATQYYSLLEEQLHSCQELSNMLTKGLESGGLVAFYLMEGNYSLVSNIIDNWHKAFTKFRTHFYLTDTPLEIISQSSNVFYYDNWAAGIIQFIAVWAVLLAFSALVSPTLAKPINSIFGSSVVPNQPISMPTVNSSQRVLTSNNTSVRQRPINRQNNQTPDASEHEQNDVATVPIQLASTESYNYIMRIVQFAILVVLIAGVQWWSPDIAFLPRPARRNWFSDATRTIDIMITNRDNLQSSLNVHILSNEELKRHASMYHDQVVQKTVDELVHTLTKGVRQVSKEVSDLYASSERVVSTYRRTYERIETKAKIAGRLAETNDLLVALNQSSDKYEALQRSILILVTNQRQVLPILKEQTQSLQALVQEGRLVEIGRIIKHHQDILLDIDGNTYKVQIEVEELIEIVSNERTDGMKKTIQSLQENTSTDQIKSLVYGALGTSSGSIMGMIALKTGYAIVTVSTTAVAGPILLVGAAGMFGLATFNAVHNFDNYQAASNFKSELAALEAERINLKVAMEQLEKAVTDQQQALKSSQTSLAKISQYCGEFSKIVGFTLNRMQRNAINEELLTITIQYNRMMAFYDLFTKNIDKKRRELPSS